MRLLLTFIIFILGGFYIFGKESCCEQCCEYLGNCCKKGKWEVKEKFYLKKTEEANPEEIKKLVNTNWYNNKGKNASFILYEKINGAGNQNINENDGTKVTKDKNGFTIDENFIPEKGNTKKWALFEIKYKKEGEEEENKEEEKKYLYCSDIESGGINGIFDSCEQYISISVIACDTSGVTDMSFMFSECSSLTKLDLFNFNTEKVTNMSAMFSDCSSLTELDLSKFNTETVTDMSGMFLDCKKLNNLSFSKFDTKNVTDMSSMFSGCSSLTELDLSKFNIEKVINMSSMFFECSSLTKLDLSKFDTKNVTNISDMFYNCSSLTELDLSKFDTKNVTDISDMFYNCSSLQTVTFNKNLHEGIKQQLKDLGLTESEEEGNKLHWKKNN